MLHPAHLTLIALLGHKLARMDARPYLKRVRPTPPVNRLVKRKFDHHGATQTSTKRVRTHEDQPIDTASTSQEPGPFNRRKRPMTPISVLESPKKCRWVTTETDDVIFEDQSEASSSSHASMSVSELELPSIEEIDPSVAQSAEAEWLEHVRAEEIARNDEERLRQLLIGEAERQAA